MWLVTCITLPKCTCHVYLMTATHSYDSSGHAWLAGRLLNSTTYTTTVQATWPVCSSGTGSYNSFSHVYYIISDCESKLLAWLKTLFAQRQERDPRISARTRAQSQSYAKDQKSTMACSENRFSLFSLKLMALHVCWPEVLPEKYQKHTVLACITLHDICLARRDIRAEWVRRFLRCRSTPPGWQWIVLQRIPHLLTCSGQHGAAQSWGAEACAKEHQAGQSALGHSLCHYRHTWAPAMSISTHAMKWGLAGLKTAYRAHAKCTNE